MSGTSMSIDVVLFPHAPHSPEVPVNLNDVFNAGPPVESIDILRDEEEVFKPVFKLFNGKVSRIRLCLADNAPSPVIPFPDRFGITLKGLQRCKLLGTVILPQPVVSPERGYPALIRNPRPGYDKEVFCLGKSFRGTVDIIYRSSLLPPISA